MRASRKARIAELPSLPVHDAQEMTAIPRPRGCSCAASTMEAATIRANALSPEDCTWGIMVLANTLLQLAEEADAA